MTRECLDPQLVRRLVRRVGAYLDGGVVSQEALAQIFEMSGADEAHQSAVRQALHATGIVVRSEAPSAATNIGVVRADSESETTQPAHGRDGCARTNGPASSYRVAAIRKQRPGVAPSEVDEARAVLEKDRRISKPWRRLLTAREEVGLATIMRDGGIPLSEALPKGFRATLTDTDDRACAFDALMLHNRGLVWSGVQRHVGQGLEMEDLEQSGYEGLRRAVEMYDASQGWKFSTYATSWINQAMSRAVANESRLVRLPVHMHDRVQKVLAVRSKLLVSGGWAPLFDIARETGLRPDQVVQCLRLAAGVVSLDAPVSGDGESTLADLLEDERYSVPDPASDLIAQETRDEILDIVQSLPARDSRIIRLRYGFDDDEPLTLEAIGAHFDLTRERIRQIEKKAKGELAVTLRARGFACSTGGILQADSA